MSPEPQIAEAQLLQQPQPGSIGTLVGINSAPLTEMISALGFDFLFLDMEHGSIPDQDLVYHIMSSRVPTLVRLSDASEVAVKRAADTGASSLVIPHVKTAEMAAAVASWAHYPPIGGRSVGLSRNTLLGYQLTESLRQTHAPSVVAQIEDAEGVGNITGICSAEGISSVFIGPYDLSASLGTPGNFGGSDFKSAVKLVVDAAHHADISVGVFAPNPAAWFDFASQGCDYVVLRSDSLFVIDGATQALQEARKYAP
jgi:2-keto-3-deoxy-L-rhamnonate aldolase RhmA